MADQLVSPVSATELDSARQFVQDVLVGQSPALNLTPGSALDGLLLTPEARLAATHTADLVALGNSFSLAAIAANLTTVTDAEVDSLVSNYFLVRRGDTPAAGPIRIISSLAVPFRIASGFTVTFNDLKFVTTQDWLVFPPDASTGDGSNTRRMTIRADGTFEFTINVTAALPGAAGQLVAGTVVLISNPLNGMVSAAVAADFTGGQDRETNAELLARAQSGITAQVSAGPDHVQALVTAEFPGATTSVVGIGDTLMVRDRYSLLPISTGGKQDVWARTSAVPRVKTLTLTGTVVVAATKAMTLTIPYADGVGAYRVTAIRPAAAVVLGGDKPAVTVQVYSQTAYKPKISNSLDAAFSANQILVCQWFDTISQGLFTAGQQVSYSVDVEYMPSIASLTLFLTARGTRMAGQDVLVRAAVPCEVLVSATIRIPVTAPTPDLAALKQSIADTINALPFGTQSLNVFTVHRAIAAAVPKGDVSNTSLRGVILAPSGTDIALPTSQELTLPIDAVALVGPDNTFFCCAPEQVELTVVSR